MIVMIAYKAIIVLDKGTIAEFGNHENLLEEMEYTLNLSETSLNLETDNPKKKYL